MSGTLRRDRRTRKATMTDQQHPADRPAVSSTVVLVVVGALLLVGLGGSILIHIIRPDASATYTAQALQFLGFLVTVLTLIYGVNKVSAHVGTVQKQTNGTLTALRDAIAEKDNIIKEQGDRLVSLAEKVPPKA